MIEFITDDLIIYGAGMVGNLVRQYLEITGSAKKIKAFAVSEAACCTDYHGYKLVPVKSLIQYANNSMVLIATFPELQNVMKDRLLEIGFKNIISINYKMYQEMADTYIWDFVSKQKLRDDYDILYLASDNNKTSGAFLCLVDLVKDMEEKGFNSLIILPEYGNGEELLRFEGIDFTYISSKTWLFRADGKELTWQERNDADNVSAIESISKIITKHNIRLIHNNTTYTHVGAIAAKDCEIPIVWHLRENIFEQGYGYKNEKDFYDLINTSSKIVVVSGYLHDCYPWLDKEKTVTIYDGVDIKRYYNERDIFDQNRVHIVLVAAVYPLKRQEDLIEASIILKKRGLDFHISIIGSGEKKYTEKLIRIIEDNGLEDYISFLGRKDNINEYYWKSDISVICSKSESFGRVCIESQLSGCLVIGANAGATKEIIDDKNTGLIYECLNSFELAEKILYAVAHLDESRRIAKKGQKKAKEIFAKENASEQIYNIYRELL